MAVSITENITAAATAHKVGSNPAVTGALIKNLGGKEVNVPMRMKGFVAAVLAAFMTMSAAGSALATSSPAQAPSVDGYVDNNIQDHTSNTVTSTISGDTGTVIKAVSNGESGSSVEFNVARNSNNEEVPITVVGDGKKGVFNTKKGRKITWVKLNSSKPTVVKKLAFKGSKVKTVRIQTTVTLNKNAFKGTKQSKITLQFKGKKASALKLKKGSLSGIKKVTVKGLSKKEYNKLLKAAKKAGIKTSIFTRK